MAASIRWHVSEWHLTLRLAARTLSSGSHTEQAAACEARLLGENSCSLLSKTAVHLYSPQFGCILSPAITP